MRRTLIVATCFVLAGLAAQAASAALINGQYVPDSLVSQVGAQYRLIFVTSGSVKADSSDPAFYDNFLSAQVQNTMLGSFNYGWKAVVSTYVDGIHTQRVAKTIVSDALYTFDNDPTTPYVGVYNTAGSQVAATGDAMLTASLLSPVLYDQHGTSVFDGYAWTGSYWDGNPAYIRDTAGNPTAIPATVGNTYSLGAPTMLGATGANNGTWLELGAVSRGGPIPFVARIYGMSNVMTVPVPEPSTIVLWSLFTGVAGLVFWRKRRQSN